MSAKTPSVAYGPAPTADSERLLRTRRLFEHARTVFDNEADAHAWLSTPDAALSGRSPLSLLDTDAGARRVDRGAHPPRVRRLRLSGSRLSLGPATTSRTQLWEGSPACRGRWEASGPPAPATSLAGNAPGAFK